MSVERDFVINFGSLGPGEHEFEFEIKDSFFQRFENSVIQKGDIDVLVVVDKKDNMFLLDFTLEGTITVACDRCLGELDLDIEGYNELIVKHGSSNEELSENVIMISSKEYEIDVSQYIYEYISLAIPMRNVHGEDDSEGCDPEVLKEIQKHISQNAEHPPTDPRWDGLKDINLN